MAKNSIDVYGASGKTNVLNFEPENLHLVTDKAHPLYDERIHLPISEAMVLNIMDQGVLEPIIVWKDPESGLSCVVDGRQRVRHTLEANKRLSNEGKEPLLVPAVTKRGSAIRMAQAMVSANMTIVKTHTGTVITKDGPQVKKLHQTERMWVVGKNEFYHKETGRRHFAENTRRRLLLETIEAIGGSHD